MNRVETIFRVSDDAQRVSQSMLKLGVERVRNRLFNHSFTPRKFYPRGSSFEPELNATRREIRVLDIEWVSQLDRLPSCNVSSTEQYIIDIKDNGHASIKMISTQGGLHALETFSQLFYTHSNSVNMVYTSYAPVEIRDCPAFMHRGLNLDISRNWISPSHVRRTIEAMAFNKFNRLHIHASDAQSWPLDIPALPELAREGAYHPEQIWTSLDLESVQEYGYYHGIEVYIEIDLPGHTSSIGHAYKDLTTAAYENDWSTYAMEPPSGQLKLNSSAVFTFLETLLHDLLPRTAKYSSLYHTGGDEVNARAYLLEPLVNASSTAVIQPLLQAMINHVFRIAESYSLTPVVWEEMLLEWNLTLPDSVLVQTWQSTEALAAVLATGHKALFGSNTHWYLDCGHGQWLDPDLSRSDTPIEPPYLDYCGPYKNWRHIYSYRPLVGIPEHQRHLVIGGEVHLWGELTDWVTLDSMLWPRVAAAAEVLWSYPDGLADESTTRRLAEMRERLVASGIAAGMVQMEWCLRYKGGCTL
jgi:hexosaminidase